LSAKIGKNVEFPCFNANGLKMKLRAQRGMTFRARSLFRACSISRRNYCM